MERRAEVPSQVDGGHFGLLYYPSEPYDAVTSAQAAFLIRHLGPLD
jgi:hypothetical protein